jgi:hypothetical protein
MVRRVAVMAAMAVAMAMAAGEASAARRAAVAEAEAVGGVSLVQRLGSIGDLRLPKIEFGKAGWGDRLRSARLQQARIKSVYRAAPARAARAARLR